MTSKLSNRAQVANAETGHVVDQTIGSIKTVVSFTGEEQAVEKYKTLIRTAYESAVHKGTAVGVGLACVQLIVYSTYGLAVWFGSKLIIDKGYSGGEVINVMLALMTGAVSLGQVSPCLKAFSTGQAAAFKAFETINRKSDIDSNDMTGIVLEDIKGDIKLDNVCFSYLQGLTI